MKDLGYGYDLSALKRWKMKAAEEHSPIPLPCKAAASPCQQHVPAIPGHCHSHEVQPGDTFSFTSLFYWVGFVFGTSRSNGDCVPNSAMEKLAPHEAQACVVLIDCFSSI